MVVVLVQANTGETSDTVPRRLSLEVAKGSCSTSFSKCRRFLTHSESLLQCR